MKNNYKKEKIFMGKALDLTGQKFGRLTALEATSERRNKSIVWKCLCDCENYVNVDASSLRRLRTQSCGCLKKESDRKPKCNVINLAISNLYFLYYVIIPKFNNIN